MPSSPVSSLRFLPHSPQVALRPWLVFAACSLFTLASDLPAPSPVLLAGVDDATPGYTRLFSGRSDQSLGEAIRISETAAGVLAGSSSLVLTLERGALFSAGSRLPVAGNLLQERGIETRAATAGLAATVDPAIRPVAGDAVIGGPFSLDLRSVSAGDLHLTLGGTSGATGRIKLAEVLDATRTTVGEASTGIPGYTLTLPPITVTETEAGALVAGNVQVLAFKDKLSDIDPATATLKVFSATGVDISAGTVMTGLTRVIPIHQTIGVSATIQPPSDMSMRPIRLVIQGLKATVVREAFGDVMVTVSGAQSTSTPDLSVPVTGSAANEVGPNQGVKMTKAVITVAKLATNFSPIDLTSGKTVVGPLEAQTIELDISKALIFFEGQKVALFLAAIVPVSGLNVLYFNSAATGWVPVQDCDSVPAYKVGQFTAPLKVPVVSAPSDLRALVGTQLYFGGGETGEGGTVGDACRHMINNGTYYLRYTIR